MWATKIGKLTFSSFKVFFELLLGSSKSTVPAMVAMLASKGRSNRR